MKKEFYFSKSGELLEEKKSEIEKLVEMYRKFDGEEKEEIARVLYYIQKNQIMLLILKII